MGPEMAPVGRLGQGSKGSGPGWEEKQPMIDGQRVEFMWDGNRWAKPGIGGIIQLTESFRSFVFQSFPQASTGCRVGWDRGGVWFHCSFCFVNMVVIFVQ
jgi:hypothetical protein